MDSSMFRGLQREFFGVDRVSRVADGRLLQRSYFDSGASCLMMKAAYDCCTEFLPHYANTHSILHFAARASTDAYEWAHEQILKFLGVSGDTYVPIFVGSGSTGALNRIASALSAARPDKPVAIVPVMEHHSNDLPHRLHQSRVIRVNCVGDGRSLGPVCLESLAGHLRSHGGEVNYVAVTGASNVTGIINPISEIAELVHAHDALLVVDGSQLIAHSVTALENAAKANAYVDAFAFSGHKAYAPGSPGVLVIRKDLLSRLPPVELGGGVVEHVYLDRYLLHSELRSREEPGTPNLLGAITLGFSLEMLRRIGMPNVVRHEQELLREALSELGAIPDLRLYGSLDTQANPRVGIITFNVTGMDHGLVAAILNDYFNIAVRNECFCAHPYVRELLVEDLWDLDPDLPPDAIQRRQGMVRASFGLYNTDRDVSALVDALRAITSDRARFTKAYRLLPSGEYKHESFQPDDQDTFSPAAALDHWLAGRHGSPRPARALNDRSG